MAQGTMQKELSFVSGSQTITATANSRTEFEIVLPKTMPMNSLVSVITNSGNSNVTSQVTWYNEVKVWGNVKNETGSNLSVTLIYGVVG